MMSLSLLVTDMNHHVGGYNVFVCRTNVRKKKSTFMRKIKGLVLVHFYMSYHHYYLFFISIILVQYSLTLLVLILKSGKEMSLKLKYFDI